MTTYTAQATRTEGWWVVEVPEVPGLFTQAKRLDQIPDMVRDALTLFPEIEPYPGQADIRIEATGELGREAERVRQLRETARQAQTEATNELTRLTKELSEQGMPYRDIGTLLDISFQRANTLAHA
ncbi:type II toxin-antitoxin system HicB family antitoxin [Arcanobacterium haemolyticum]|nr:type II toxin-antitoxin system HicB family antitoxin [Arcanobacterium haemolyticum]